MYTLIARSKRGLRRFVNLKPYARGIITQQSHRQIRRRQTNILYAERSATVKIHSEPRVALWSRRSGHLPSPDAFKLPFTLPSSALTPSFKYEGRMIRRSVVSHTVTVVASDSRNDVMKVARKLIVQPFGSTHIPLLQIQSSLVERMYTNSMWEGHITSKGSSDQFPMSIHVRPPRCTSDV